MRAVVALVLGLVFAGCVAVPAPPAESSTPPTEAAAGPGWGDPLGKSLHPGAMAEALDRLCTTDFLFEGADGVLYLGTAAHCFTAEEWAVNACPPGDERIGSEVVLRAHDGTYHGAYLAYSSFAAMAAAGETPGPACEANDFALLKLAPKALKAIHPALVGGEGPIALAGTDSLAPEDTVTMFGSTPLRPEGDELIAGEPRKISGSLFAVEASGWRLSVQLSEPSKLGDSGGGLVDAEGRAIGVMSRSTSSMQRQFFTALEPALQYARDHGGPDVELVAWTGASA